jgi:predicted DNA-binding transcriptional regulator AlpA
MPDDLLTTAELAAMLGLSPHTIHQRRYRGDSLPRSISISANVIRYRRSEIEAWLEEHTDQPEHATDDPS